jgi:hypothetical protein
MPCCAQSTRAGKKMRSPTPLSTTSPWRSRSHGTLSTPTRHRRCREDKHPADASKGATQRKLRVVLCPRSTAPHRGCHVLTAVYDHTDGDREERHDFNSKSELSYAHLEPKSEENGMDRRRHSNIDHHPILVTS